VAESAHPDPHWRLVGARPCLDFVNTVGGRVSPDGAGFADQVTRDDLPDYESLVRWGAFASVLEPGERDRLRDHARRAPADARRVLKRARTLREALYRIGKSLVEDWAPPADDLAVLGREIAEARRHQRLVARKRRVETEWVVEGAALDRVLWPVALSAAAVFGSDDVRLLKQCPGTACGWLFVDTTRNHSRQWCEMADCGNLAKVRRFRQRRRRRGRHA
jgi:predicted RNA-binding Zn ribbon-like protein